MKKNLLIVIDSLGSGGAEKSLINLLGFIDYYRVEVDLLMFGRGGINEEYLPCEVNVLPTLAPEVPAGFLKRVAFLVKKYVYSAFLRIAPPKTANDDTRRIWRFFSSDYPSQPKTYDVAFAYAQRLPSIYVAEKVNASNKYTWMNVTIHHSVELQKYYDRYLSKFNKVICVSDVVRQSFIKCYPHLQHNTETIYDIVNPEFISALSQKECTVEMTDGVINILTVARLNFEQKGYDILIQVCNELKQRGLSFHWNILGDGKDKEKIKSMISSLGLEDCISLLGTVANPYPYFKKSHIYVQTSRYEGYGLSIAEARLLNIPVVTTAYDCVDLQIKNGINGIITSYEIADISDAIEKLVGDSDLYKEIADNLSKEKKGNIEEFKKIQKLIGY